MGGRGLASGLGPGVEKSPGMDWTGGNQVFMSRSDLSMGSEAQLLSGFLSAGVKDFLVPLYQEFRHQRFLCVTLDVKAKAYNLLALLIWYL